MSKVPDQHGRKIPPPKSRTVESKTDGSKLPETGRIFTSTPTRLQRVQSEPIHAEKTTQPAQQESIKKLFSYGRGFGLMIPRISAESLEKKIVQNPRILDLRNKLNEINKRREHTVDKETKTLINDITQQLEQEEETSESGPYSLLLDLNDSAASTSTDFMSESQWQHAECACKSLDCDIISDATSSGISSLTDRRPNIINLEGKSMSEFEYSCEIPDKVIPRSSRSDLCLHFTNSPANNKSNKMDTLSPNTDSLHRISDDHSIDDSLGILTPDQMDDMFSPTVESLPIFRDDIKVSPDSGESPSTEKTQTNSPVSTMFMENEAPSAHASINTGKCHEHGDQMQVVVGNETEHHNVQDVGIVPDVSQAQVECNMYESINKEANYPSVDMMLLDDNALQFGESDCKEFFINKGEEIFKDTSFVPNVDDELLPSVHSSILEPISSLIDTTINLDLSLDSKHYENLKSQTSQRVEQTPSPEDLPLDPSELNVETETYSSLQVSSATVQDSQTYSEPKTDLAKSMETSKVSSSFITSITSMTSLDGYQGDGEMSRPVSRGADPPGNKDDVVEMNWQNVPVNRRPDPMTDSDFFTESDADGHDDHMHRGDRRAQVIDGALYGGKKNNAPLIVNRNDDSCMESSGVYTDLENHRSSPVFLNAIEDLSPDGSSPSTRSELSQKNLSDTVNNDMKSRALIGSDKSPAHDKKSQKNSKIELKAEKTKEEKRFSLKKYKMPKRDVPSKLKTMLNRKPDSDGSVQSSPSTKTKKNERREIIPKKTIEAKPKSFKDVKSKVDCCFSLQRSQTACSVTRMLSAKSTTAAKPKTRHRSRLELATTSGKSSLHSSQSDLSAICSPPARMTLTRTAKKRDGVAGAVAAPAAPAGGVSSPRAPASPPALPPALGKKPMVSALPKLPASPVSVRGRPAPTAAPAAPAATAVPASPRKPLQRRLQLTRPSTLNTGNVKEPARNSVRSSGKRGVSSPAAQHAPLSAPLVVPLTAPPQVSPAPCDASQAALSHAAKGVEALGVLVQYLVCQLESLNGETWRAEAARWRALAAAERAGAARANHDHQQRTQKDLDTIGECLSKISELEMEVSAKEEQNARLLIAGRDAEQRFRATLEDITALSVDIKGLKDTIDALKLEVEESRARVCAGADRERALAAQLEAVRRDLASAQIERNPDLDKEKTELVAEVRSLRAVLELKQAEASELRRARSNLAAESERRASAERELDALRQAAEELRERAAARQRDADALRDENRRLREHATRDQQAHARLALYNEELRYKLRQKSQVVSLLANGGSSYLDRSYGTPRARAASCGSGARTPSPPPDSPSPSDSPSPPAAPNSPEPARRAPAVKGVVEKQDSVSWVLEIEESPEEVANRLARRSNSFRNGGGGGVKRRGGGSPGAPSSPAPASPAPNATKLFRCSASNAADLAAPPLKESGGEAIYIYDNRQY